MYSFKMNVEDYKWFAERSRECSVYDDDDILGRVRWFEFAIGDTPVDIHIRYRYDTDEWFAVVFSNERKDQDYFAGLSYGLMIYGIKKRLKELGVPD